MNLCDAEKTSGIAQALPDVRALLAELLAEHRRTNELLQELLPRESPATLAADSKPAPSRAHSAILRRLVPVLAGVWLQLGRRRLSDSGLVIDVRHRRVATHEGRNDRCRNVRAAARCNACS
jgi:hypothetical protein